jgi:hypothetical protein
MVDMEAFKRGFSTETDWCLPVLLRVVKEIIQTLAPQRDHESLHEDFDVELLMQQFDHGVLNFFKGCLLAVWCP